MARAARRRPPHGHARLRFDLEPGRQRRRRRCPRHFGLRLRRRWRRRTRLVRRDDEDSHVQGPRHAREERRHRLRPRQCRRLRSRIEGPVRCTVRRRYADVVSARDAPDLRERQVLAVRRQLRLRNTGDVSNPGLPDLRLRPGHVRAGLRGRRRHRDLHELRRRPRLHRYPGLRHLCPHLHSGLSRRNEEHRQRRGHLARRLQGAERMHRHHGCRHDRAMRERRRGAGRKRSRDHRGRRLQYDLVHDRLSVRRHRRREQRSSPGVARSARGPPGRQRRVRAEPGH